MTIDNDNERDFIFHSSFRCGETDNGRQSHDIVTVRTFRERSFSVIVVRMSSVAGGGAANEDAFDYGAFRR
eukprot:CAMPEP_0172517484 /NCGR_PEP_ID=MMETSP1066-20121228/285385_1 /TAXON_ID=671091 /ORGANISM="Coscinodiscus wailesii, Strain CCMP2513" /LENGTH=70 /DNA_ID=CAMNT_0013299501 /DNA_START=625 /DNA_END=837 /DNA_ORIENTATION=+